MMIVEKNDIDMLNTLSYLHLLPSKEFKKERSRIFKHVNSKGFVNGNTKKAFSILNKHLSE